MRYLVALVTLVGATLLSSGYVVLAEDSAPTYSAGVHAWRNVGGDLQPYFIVDDAGLWPTHQIEVCWVTLTLDQAKERALAQSAVQKFIEANSDFRFGQSWNKCDSTLKARIQITVADTDEESEVGYKGGSFPTDISLNFQFKRWNPDCSVTEDRRQNCIQTVAVHEFLHALGTLHEQLSQDLAQKDPACYLLYKDRQDYFGARPRALTEYDAGSIMNYCNKIYATPPHLSDLDIKGLKALSARSGQLPSVGL